jgi:hypothetical protein
VIRDPGRSTSPAIIRTFYCLQKLHMEFDSHRVGSDDIRWPVKFDFLHQAMDDRSLILQRRRETSLVNERYAPMRYRRAL